MVHSGMAAGKPFIKRESDLSAPENRQVLRDSRQGSVAGTIRLSLPGRRN